MFEVQRSLRQKVVGGAAVAVLLGGGAFAAVSATGQGNGHVRKHASNRVHRVHRVHALHARDIAAAASYLGVSTDALASELREGKSLARLAAKTPGKPEDGLVAALVAAKQQRIAARVAGADVAQARAKRRQERLQKRMIALTKRKFARHASP